MESYIYNIVSRICVCPVCINALSDCVIVYSGFCGCISFYCVFWFLFLPFISHYYYYFHMIFPCLLFSLFYRFCDFCFSFSYSLTQRFSRAISHHTFSPLARSDSYSQLHCFAHSHRVLFIFLNLPYTRTLVLV